MYDYQIKKKRQRILFEGDELAVREYIASASQT